MYFFRFDSKDQFRDLANAAGFIYVDEDGNNTLVTASHSYAIDEIGEIWQGGEYNEEGEVITPSELLPGWHVNYIGSLPDGWEDYTVTPVNPHRIFAGA